MTKMFFILAILSVTLFIACDQIHSPSDEVIAQKQEQLMQEANAQLGMPAIVNFQERKLMKMIFELRDRTDLVCYAYTYSEYTGKFRFLGKCLGYGLPYSTQYANPQRIETYREGLTTIPQADPNGLFMPESAEATWLMLLDSSGTAHPIYCEPKLVISATPLPNSILSHD